ncbi:DUF397 domain-containing protein [Streptomyces sp. NPDC017230]|uniref:DUF397 domain-containing protein n=1 Tax=unclassified Streptomyces TaxID=2593676 RepID=UPI00379D4B66
MSDFDFVKSSYSNTSGECVEVALNAVRIVAVRDSKNPGGGPIVRLGREAWGKFTASLE